MNCDKCIHKGICKNEDVAREWEKKFKESEIFTTKPVYIFLQLTCKEFSNKYSKTKKEQ